MKKRKNNFDLLRIVSCIAVIAIHVNAIYLSPKISSYMGGSSITWTIENFINFATRFSVPCFVMMSGAFILNDERTTNIKLFWHKSIFKILIPFLLIYLIWSLIYWSKAIIITDDIEDFLLTLFKGTYGNLWFMPMLIGLYFLAPFIANLKGSRHIPFGIGLFLLAWAIISQSTSNYNLPYSTGVVFSYLSYFIFGNILYESKCVVNQKILIFGIICVTILGTWWRCNNHQYYAMDYSKAFFSPLVVVLSIQVFYFFKQLIIDDLRIEWISSKTFYIYLLHSPILVIVHYIFEYINNISEISKIMLQVLVVFILSLIAAVFYEKIIILIANKLKDAKITTRNTKTDDIR